MCKYLMTGKIRVERTDPHRSKNIAGQGTRVRSFDFSQLRDPLKSGRKRLFNPQNTFNAGFGRPVCGLVGGRIQPLPAANSARQVSNW
jgi:hypothetical protein